MFMQIEKSIRGFLNDCRSRQLRPKTILSYEQSVRLFAGCLKQERGIDRGEQVDEMTLREYILYLQVRGKYSAWVDDRMTQINRPKKRREYMVAENMLLID